VWEPGTRHGYHALTFGWLVGEVIRRITGKSVGRFVTDEISGPLGLDLWIGLPESEEPRVARLIAAEPIKVTAAERETMHPLRRKSLEAMADPSSLGARALNVTKPPFNFNSRAVHAAELPAGNAIATARSLARMYAATIGDVDGGRLLSPETVADASREVSSGPDEVLIVPTRFASGFFLPSPFEPMLGPTSFGHAGAGGSLAFADPDSGVAFGYVMNSMQQNMANDPRTRALKHAVRDAIA
jgi:CubicO group peptidase (beta-lactamase class C family)